MSLYWSVYLLVYWSVFVSLYLKLFVRGLYVLPFVQKCDTVINAKL